VTSITSSTVVKTSSNGHPTTVGRQGNGIARKITSSLAVDVQTELPDPFIICGSISYADRSGVEGEAGAVGVVSDAGTGEQTARSGIAAALESEGGERLPGQRFRRWGQALGR
jgi:hypothetical protein